jgi:hypothetical protein
LTELQSLRCIEVTDTDTLTGAVVGENGCSLDFSNQEKWFAKIAHAALLRGLMIATELSFLVAWK